MHECFLDCQVLSTAKIGIKNETANKRHVKSIFLCTNIG